MSTDRLIARERSFSIEVLESLVRTYLVRIEAAHGLVPGKRVELVIADNPPVPCTIAADEAGALRLIRGWVLSP